MSDSGLGVVGGATAALLLLPLPGGDGSDKVEGGRAAAALLLTVTVLSDEVESVRGAVGGGAGVSPSSYTRVPKLTTGDDTELVACEKKKREKGTEE